MILPGKPPLNMFNNAVLKNVKFSTRAHQFHFSNSHLLGRKFSTTAWKKPHAFGSKAFVKGSAIIGISAGLTIYSIYNPTLINETLHSSTFRDKSLLSNKKILKPDESAETFEIGLFLSSQRELEAENDAVKQKQIHGRLGYLYRLKYLFLDYVWENLITVGRFVEISLILLPVFIVFPMSWFGPKMVSENKERYGSVLWYRLLRHAVEFAGASFIKLGQWAASRTDIFPTQLCHEFSNLHSNAKAHSLHQTKRIICSTFGIDNFDDIFEEFNVKPLGVGAIAQVYVAKFNAKFVKDAPPGWVAIKVLHPNVEIKIERDLRIMNFFATVIDYIPTMEWLSLPQEVEQFSLLMRLQLDLRIEGANLHKFQENFAEKHDIKFPTPFLKFSGRQVLVEEFIKGISIAKFLKLSNTHEENPLLTEISDKVLDSFLQMLILNNFIHADLHPGNIMLKFYRLDEKIRYSRKDINSRNAVSSDEEMVQVIEKLKGIEDAKTLNDKLMQLHSQGFHAEICYIDTGLVTELNEVDRVNFIELFNALSEFDGYRAGELMIERSRTPETVVSNEIFALKVERLVDRIKQRTFTLGNLSIGDLLDQVLGMVRQHHVRMEGDFITVIVAILLLEGIGRQLDPNLDLFASALPVLRQLGLQDGKYLLKSGDTLSMIKVWMALEMRQFIHASIQDIHNLVKSDGLCPNY